MNSTNTQQIALVAAVLMAASMIGIGLGRLLHDNLPTAPTPRTARARAYLRACHDPFITTETRISNACEAIYFCCIDVADHGGVATESLDHPDDRIVRSALHKLRITEANSTKIFALLDWRLYAIPSQPKPCTEDVAFALARAVYLKTLKFLKG